MSVTPEARGRGIASDLTTTLLERAKELGCRRVVLHSSEMAVDVYRRAGVVDCCSMTVRLHRFGRVGTTSHSHLTYPNTGPSE
jgi:ribosomal protein S18 acetylase RimI-like enzyme